MKIDNKELIYQIGELNVQKSKLVDLITAQKAKIEQLEKQLKEQSNGVPPNVPKDADVEELLPAHKD